MHTFLLMDDSTNELLRFLMWPLQRQQWVLPCNCLVGALPYSHYVMGHSPCAELGFSTPHNMIYSITIVVTAHKKKRYPACLVHAVIGMFYSIVASQRQPQYTHNVLQRRCQPRPTTMYMFLRGEGQYTPPIPAFQGVMGSSCIRSRQ